MASFLLTLVRLGRALRGAWHEPDFRNVLLLVVLMLVSGTIFYVQVEGWSPVDALYFSVVTLATVGYGDLAPKTVQGKLFTIVYIVVGVGLFFAMVRYLAEGLLQRKGRRDEADDADEAR